MNKEYLCEILRLDPKKVPDEVEFWALYATSLYEKIFSKINDPEKLHAIYKRLKMNPKLKRRDSEALEFFYKLRLDELENPDFWELTTKRKLGENMKAKLVKEEMTPADYGAQAARYEKTRDERIREYAIDVQDAIQNLIELGELTDEELPEDQLNVFLKAWNLARKFELKFG